MQNVQAYYTMPREQDKSFGRLCTAYKYDAFLLSYQKRDLKIPVAEKSL